VPAPLSLDAMIGDEFDLTDVLPDPRDDIAAVDDADELRWLADLVDRLSQPQATVLRLELAGQRPRQIAKELGVSLQTVHNRRNAAVERLRALVAS
jgi:DNA-directed RNA polymerase specialized sigma24 family protein